MKKIYLLFIVLVALPYIANGQKSTSSTQAMPYGRVDTADLKLTECSFENDADAMVLFDKGVLSHSDDYKTIELIRHKRIKILKDEGKDAANIRLEYIGYHRDEAIMDVEAETINLNGKTIEYTPVDKKQIYTENTDNEIRAIVFTFPNVKVGSVIEFKYKWRTFLSNHYPDWNFQSSLPTRYSEISSTAHHFNLGFTEFKKAYQKFARDTVMIYGKKFFADSIKGIWALSNVKAFKREPYMGYEGESVQRMRFVNGLHKWEELGKAMIQDRDFGEQLGDKLINEQLILNKVNSLHSDEEKVAFLFKMVKDSMTWNKINRRYTEDDIQKAWKKKTGNSTEINLALYHFLKLSGITADLLVVCPRTGGIIDRNWVNFSNLKKTIVNCTIDSAKHYFLDASDKYSSYADIPYDFNGLNAFSIDPENKIYRLITLPSGKAREIVMVNANISGDGKIEGTINANSYSYRRYLFLAEYKNMGEKAYIEKIQNNTSGLKVTSLKLQNIEVDSLPLTRIINFSFTMPELDGSYLYVNPSQFASVPQNPFLSETRIADIDFGCLNNYSINGQYKLPAGYKIEALPKTQLLELPDNSISFKRVVAEQDGNVLVHYVIVYKRAVFAKQEYPVIREFYKRMYEMLNEPIVLKKG